MGRQKPAWPACELASLVGGAASVNRRAETTPEGSLSTWPGAGEASPSGDCLRRPLEGPTLTPVDLLVWSAARRLALLVAGSLVFVAVPFALAGRIGSLAAVSGASAVALLVTALLPLLRARRILRDDAQATPDRGVYRASARAADRDPLERAAVRHAAIALMLVAVAAALTIVAAAAR
jgi:hypothetical protein